MTLRGEISPINGELKQQVGQLLVDFQGNLSLPSTLKLAHDPVYINSIKKQYTALIKSGLYRYDSNLKTRSIYNENGEAFRAIIQKQINSVQQFFKDRV